jgi:hypothetical protein
LAGKVEVAVVMVPMSIAVLVRICRRVEASKESLVMKTVVTGLDETLLVKAHVLQVESSSIINMPFMVGPVKEK